MKPVFAGSSRPAFVDARHAAALASVGPAAAVAWVIVERPDQLRLLIAVTFIATMLAVAVRRPAAAAFLTLIALPFEALLRRLLISQAGWGGNDPLILVGPAVSIALFASLFLARRRPLITDPLSALVLAFVGLAVLGVLNPAGRGIAVELGGVLFIAAPLVWFFLGRELGSPALIRRLLVMMVAIGLAVSAYGLWQTEVDLPSWDETWVHLTTSPSYRSLNVGRALRPFSTFSSNQEYALWIAGALAVAVALALHGRAASILAAPVLASALLLASVRSALVLAVFAITVALGLRTRRLSLAAVIVVLGLGLAFAGLRFYGAVAHQAAAASGNDLIARQVGGIVNPLDPRQSTLLLHWDMLVAGLRSGVTSPLGAGPGATNLAVARLGGDPTVGSTEIDLSNAFVSLGAPGGLVFAGILVLGFIAVTRRYLGGETLALPVLALLVVLLGQWLTGGMYALMPLFWFVFGWVSARPEVAK